MAKCFNAGPIGAGKIAPSFCRSFAAKSVLLLEHLLKYVLYLLLQYKFCNTNSPSSSWYQTTRKSVGNGSPTIVWQRGLLQGKALATSFGDSPDI